MLDLPSMDWLLVRHKRFMEFHEKTHNWKYVCPICGHTGMGSGYYSQFRNLNMHLHSHCDEELRGLVLRLAMEEV